MNRHTHTHSYSYPGHNVAHSPRYSQPHSNSSAFSASANPNEDWTKISDLAERRRIQNRIAQRNYRKKLKRRLEDLERRAGSTSASPEPTSQELEPSGDQQQQETQPKSQPRRWSTMAISSTSQHLGVPEPLYPPASSSYHYTRRQSRSPSSLLMPHTSFGGQDGTTAPIYPVSPYQPSYTSATTQAPMYSSHLTPKPTKTASMVSSEVRAVKQDPYEVDDLSNAFTLAYVPTIALGESSFQESNTNQYTPPLSHVDSFSDNSFPSSVMGSPPDLWALYSSRIPTPPPSVSELNDCAFFTLDPIDDLDFLSLLPEPIVDDSSFFNL